MGLISFILLETVFLFLLNIPEGRLVATKTAYQIMVFSVFFTVVIVSFNALLVAHEDLIWIAFTSVINVFLNLLLAFLLNIFLVYLLLKVELNIKYILLTFVLIQLFIFVNHLLFINKVTRITISEYLNQVLYKILIPIIISILSCALIVNYIISDLRFIYTLLFSFLTFSISIYLIGLSVYEKKAISIYLSNLI